MPLSPGTKLGVYEVTAQIGAGGMGEVYRAHDTTLDRDVAIKVLPDAFANDPERLARFEREAKVLASLNHPNIAAIYGLEKAKAGEPPALILELVEGPTVADLIAPSPGLRPSSPPEGERGKGKPLPLEEALPIARQIAEALEAAHEHGIVHRDLKPANVKVKADGTVKVLDFGIAKALSPDGGEGMGEGDANSPTMTMTAAATKMGVIMGTAAYMSPEQAKGRQVDKRTDIWAFGVVLYEMLTGRQAFGGTDISETLASVLMREIDWAALPAKTPASVRRMLRRCLTRDRRNRLADMSMARLEIDEVEDAPESATAVTTAIAQPAAWQRPISVAAIVVGAIIVTSLAVWSLTRSEEVPARVGRFTLMAPGSEPVNLSNSQQDLTLSPDGTRIVYMAGSSNEASALTVRAVDQLIGERLDATVAPIAFNPFISPDNAWVGFFNFDTSTLNKVSILGGPAIMICEVGSRFLEGASWSADDTIIFGNRDPSGLWRVPAGGGEPVEITTLEAERGVVNHSWPEVLPGGHAVLFTILTNDLNTAQIAVADLATGEHRVLVPGGHAPRYAATGHLVYAAAGTLRAVGFNLDTLSVVGNPVPVVDGVVTKPSGAANFDLADDGSLVYVSGGVVSRSERTLVWVDRQGNEEPLTAEPRSYNYPRISPDGTKVALDVRDEENDIWIWDLVRETLTRLTFASENDGYPVWTPDGQRVAFSSNRDGVGNLFWKAADGTGAVERLTESPNPQNPYAFTPDGTQLIYRQDDPDSGLDLGVLSMEGERSSAPLLVTEFAEFNAELSPDGRWLAYQSNASGQQEIYVRPFPDVDGGRWQISPEGGVQPLWGPNGQELFYRTGNSGVAAVRVETDPSFRPGNPEVLFDGAYLLRIGRNYDISPDGQRFLMIKAGGGAADLTAQAQIVIVQNWFEELNARVPVP